MTILGTRPEIIRLSRVIELLDKYCEHQLVHTGQNYEDRLSDVFFQEMAVRKPNLSLSVRESTFGAQAGQILAGCEDAFHEYRPERLLILGDTNSGLSAIVARRLGIPVYHMEAGNRCFDDRVPEEINRRVIDSVSSILMPYTHRSKENLIREGFAPQNIFVIGNPIKEVLDHYSAQIAASRILEKEGLSRQRFFLVTMHRAENVDVERRLRNLIQAFCELHREYGFPIVCSLHPRTRDRATSFGFDLNHSGIRFSEPLGFFDFVRLEQSAFCILSDSGTVQEEACIMGIPNVTIRDVTERPETVECGSNILAGCEPDVILQAVAMVTRKRGGWQPPSEYLVQNVADTVVRILLGRSQQHHQNFEHPGSVRLQQRKRAAHQQSNAHTHHH